MSHLIDGEGVVIGIKYLDALLTQCRTRRGWTCRKCNDVILKGAWAWRVLVESRLFPRYNRICMACAQVIVGDAGIVKERE